MSATNHTQNYDLSQFVGGDIPSWLNDYNGDMSKIDAAIASVAQGSGDVAADVASLKSRMTSAEADIDAAESNISTLQNTTSTQGAAITQNANNITKTNNNVSALDARVTSLENSTVYDFDLSAHTGNAVITGPSVDTTNSEIKYLLNDDKSIGKLYGGLLATIATLNPGENVVANLAIADLPTINSPYTINMGFCTLFSGTSPYGLEQTAKVSLRFKTDNSIDVIVTSLSSGTKNNVVGVINIAPCVLFLEDLGD